MEGNLIEKYKRSMVKILIREEVSIKKISFNRDIDGRKIDVI